MDTSTKENNDYPADGMVSAIFQTNSYMVHSAMFNSAMSVDKFQTTSLHFGALDLAIHCFSPDLHRSSMPWVYIDGGCGMKHLGLQRHSLTMIRREKHL